MKLLDKLTSRMAKTASTTVKEEVQGAALDILPTLLGLGGMIFGVVLFKNRTEALPQAGKLPKLTGYSSITITTNNYYFGADFMNRDQKEEEEQ